MRINAQSHTVHRAHLRAFFAFLLAPLPAGGSGEGKTMIGRVNGAASTRSSEGEGEAGADGCTDSGATTTDDDDKMETFGPQCGRISFSQPLLAAVMRSHRWRGDLLLLLLLGGLLEPRDAVLLALKLELQARDLVLGLLGGREHGLAVLDAGELLGLAVGLGGAAVGAQLVDPRLLELHVERLLLRGGRGQLLALGLLGDDVDVEAGQLLLERREGRALLLDFVHVLGVRLDVGGGRGGVGGRIKLRQLALELEVLLEQRVDVDGGGAGGVGVGVGLCGGDGGEGEAAEGEGEDDDEGRGRLHGAGSTRRGA
eukprot:Unigene698_Nuclearia_a/m.2197 Unigene698_Nuclearia_a/g.2197  ORF Unigene698_Nuclearia_a/g.2197 Unigene698_Nuclearia_a/m.2197 type:complete len:313 (-) Unigene698_Nuclearia_a:58-996(-)